MTKKDKSILKDKIIEFCLLKQEPGVTMRMISDHLNIEYSIIYSMTQELIFKDYLKKLSDISSKISFTDYDMMLTISPQGKYFFNYEGGHLDEFKKELQKQIWNFTKIIAATGNAVAIVLISFWGIKVNDSSTKSEKIIIQKDSIINKQALEITKLRFILNKNLLNIKNNKEKNVR